MSKRRRGEAARQVLEMQLEHVPRLIQCLRYYFCMAQNRHEIRIAIPARHDMKVQVVINAGAGYLSQIHADIQAVRLHGCFDDLAALREK